MVECVGIAATSPPNQSVTFYATNKSVKVKIWLGAQCRADEHCPSPS
jgi:hypothetical protein